VCWLCAIDDSLYEAASNRRTLEKLDKWRDRLNVRRGDSARRTARRRFLVDSGAHAMKHGEQGVE
jgi:hypothetical protein